MTISAERARPQSDIRIVTFRDRVVSLSHCGFLFLLCFVRLIKGRCNKLCYFLTYHVIIPIVLIAKETIPCLTVYIRPHLKRDSPPSENERKSLLYGLVIVNKLLEKTKDFVSHAVIEVSCFEFIFQGVLAAKDIELEQYKSLVQELKHEITALQMDTDKTSLVVLQQVCFIVCLK